jgi:hypothetical protein
MTNINAVSDFTNVYLSDQYAPTHTWTNSGNLVFAGAIQWHVNSTNVTNGQQIAGSVVTFCIEIGQDVVIDQGPYTWTLSNLVGAPTPTGNNGGGSLLPPNPNTGMDQTKVNLLYGLYVEENSLFPSLFTPTSNPSAGYKTEAAAFQLAIWEIVYEDSGTYDLTSGNFQSSSPSTVITRADYLLSRDVAQNYVYGNSPVVALESPTAQDQVLAFLPDSGAGPNGVQNAPLPATMWNSILLLCVFTGGYMVLRRCTTKNTRTAFWRPRSTSDLL